MEGMEPPTLPQTASDLYDARLFIIVHEELSRYANLLIRHMRVKVCLEVPMGRKTRYLC